MSTEELDCIINKNDEEENPDLSEWMTNLPDELKDIPFNQLAIPGSHDSGAFWLNRGLPIAPGGRIQRRLGLDESWIIKLFGRCTKSIILNWSLTQKLSIAEQLKHGIRYIDMRTVYFDDEDDFFFCHGLYGAKTSTLLEEINTFLIKHPKEIVLVDFNHFYNFNSSLHDRFTKLIIDVFGEKNYPPPSCGVEFTLNDIWKVNKQVILFYNNHTVAMANMELWPQTFIQSPWFNTSSTSELLRCLHHRFDDCQKDTFNVFQAILTPQLSTILCHVTNSLEKYLATKCNEAVSHWLMKIYARKKRGANIIICDFVTHNNCPADIIRLNNLHITED